MAHMLEKDMTNKVPFAFTGPREAIWHGLGQQLESGKNIDEWIKSAGFEWHFQESPAYFENDKGEKIEFEGKKILRRSDSQQAISIVSDKFCIVQPRQILEFFRDLVEKHGMELNTAGIVQNGKAFWALANMDKEAEIVKGDKVKGSLLLTTSVDGMQSTQAKFVSTRVVCNNTLQVALKGGGRAIRVTHKQDFDANKIKIDLGVIDSSWNSFINSLKSLANKPMSDTDLRAFVSKMFYDPSRKPEDQPYGINNTVESIIAKAKGGSGADFHKGTYWGALCGVTENFTHIESARMNSESKFMSAYMGESSDKKSQAFIELVMSL